MQRFKSTEHVQTFLSVFGPIGNHFRPGRHRLSACQYRLTRAERFATWRQAVGLHIGYSAQPSSRMKDLRPGRRKPGFWGTLGGGLMGEFNEDPTFAMIGTDLAVSLVPILDQASDVRDLSAHLYYLTCSPGVATMRMMLAQKVMANPRSSRATRLQQTTGYIQLR